LLLATVGAACPALQEINVSLSEQVTDVGLTSLVPCSSLASVDLLKCWGVTPRGIAGLLLGLPRLRKLYYANMKAVMEVLRARRGTSDPSTSTSSNSTSTTSTFLLDHFDSSEYSMMLPGEDARPEVQRWAGGRFIVEQVVGLEVGMWMA